MIRPRRCPMLRVVTEAGRGQLFAALAAASFGTSYVATSVALRSFSP